MQRNLIKTHINNAPNSGALRQCFLLTNSEVPFFLFGNVHRSCRDHEVCTRVSAAGGRVSAGRQAGIKKKTNAGKKKTNASKCERKKKQMQANANAKKKQMQANANAKKKTNVSK